MEFVPLVVAAALVWKIVDLAKYLISGDARGTVTQLVAWLAGVAVAMLLAASDFAGGIDVGGVVLANANGASLVLFGIALGSTGAVGYDFKKAIDASDSASVPRLPLPTARRTGANE